MYVYLFKFDSVRNSPEEIRGALEEMRRQILLYGNTVVLSYNQITDSLAFLAGIYDDRSYEAVMNLIRNGRIKMIRFAGARTPSEYMQNAIKKYLDEETADTFRFSGLPTGTRAADLEEKRRDLRLVYEALRCSDPWLLKQESERAREAGDAEAARRYIMLEHYVQMILLLSTREDTYIREREDLENRPLTYFLDEFVRSAGAGGEAGSIGAERTDGARPGAGPAESAGSTDARPAGSTGARIEPQVLAGSLQVIREIRAEHDMLLSRSLWYSWLRERWEAAADEPTRRAVEFTEALIDVCYNFTVESSIPTDLSHAINTNGEADLIAAMWKELESYWSDFGTAHIPFCDRVRYTECMEARRMYDESWETFDELRKVDRVIADTMANPGARREVERIGGTDAEALRRQHRRWVWSIFLGIFRNIGIALAYIVLFVAIQQVLSLAQGVFEDSVAETAAPWIRYAGLITTIAGIILFGICSSVLSSMGGVQDILDSIKQIGCAIRDLRYIAQASRGDRKRA